MSSTWLFTVWGIDIISGLPTGRSQVKYVMVAEWVKAKLLAKITVQKFIDFIKRSIVCRFGIPKSWFQIMEHSSRVSYLGSFACHLVVPTL